jgi:hypothetical protein
MSPLSDGQRFCSQRGGKGDVLGGRFTIHDVPFVNTGHLRTLFHTLPDNYDLSAVGSSCRNARTFAVIFGAGHVLRRILALALAHRRALRP